MTQAVTALALLLMAWFAVGSVRNVRKGNAALRWMQAGLPRVGERTTLRWLGTTSVEMVIAKARAPFDRVTIVVFLQPRDVPWVWGLARARGRRDTLLVRASLKRPPLHDLEALDRTSWSGRDARRGMESERWSVREPGTPGAPALFYKYDAAVGLADALLALTGPAGMTVRRLSVRRAEPHLQLHVDLPGPSVPAAEFFEALRAIGQRATPS